MNTKCRKDSPSDLFYRSAMIARSLVEEERVHYIHDVELLVFLT